MYIVHLNFCNNSIVINLCNGIFTLLKYSRGECRKNFLFRGHRKCSDSECISVWYGNTTNQDCKALQRVVCLAERISGSTLPSLQDIYLKRCRSRAAKITKDSNHPGNHLFILLPSGKRFRSMMAKTEELLPPGHQAPKLKLSLITST